MNDNSVQRPSVFLLVCLMAVVIAGCAKGPLWRTGYLAPWVTKQWADEERLAQTLLAKRANLRGMVQAAQKAGPADQEQAAQRLSEIIDHDPVLLLRIEAVELLGELDSPTAETSLARAANDPNAQVRMAAVFACATRNNQFALETLQKMVGSDTDIDVRLAATRALANFEGSQAVMALSLALDDPNPALQVRAADSLRSVTGEKHGRDIEAWRRYVASTTPTAPYAERQTSAEESTDLQRR